jgi:tRNA-splicing ligase RtcB (3'-phosphate/5'-hydroxy nucleic acid ligase)
MEQINRGLLSWASILEDTTREQAIATAALPFIHPHVALMPDAHWGMGSTVGSVIPTLGVVMPAAVGVDIGCGMSATRTQLTAADLDAIGPLAGLRKLIEQEVPVSAGNYRDELSPTAEARVGELERAAANQDVEPDRYSSTWRRQLGTLGSGNHFIEVCLDEAFRVWVFLHSGSRGVGNKIAQFHVKIAQRECARWHIPLPHRDLAYLPEGDATFWAYIRDLRWAQAFAAANRAEMVDQVVACLAAWAGSAISAEETITCHHNYTEQERHFGKDVWLTRKGAINAERGRYGLIPGSMGTRSYVVRGLGNPVAFNSAPHGAGRNFSRAEARRRFTTDQLATAMTGIEWRAENAEAFLDEIPGAYKDVDVVMRDAADLVEVEHTLRQVLNVKGD